VLVYDPVEVAPGIGHLHLGFVDEPAAADRVPARRGRVDREGREAPHPSVQGDVIHVDPTFGQDLLEVAIPQAEP
jgi:hypothetical protein